MKNVFFKNIQQHVRHSTIISHIVADPQTWGRWRGISKMTTTGEFWRQTETHSWSFVFAHIKKLSLKEKERKGWKEMSAKGRAGVGGGGGVGGRQGSLCSAGERSWAPSFAARATQADTNPNSNLLTRRMGLESSHLARLKKKKCYTFPTPGKWSSVTTA